jgi:hypothetical protein
MSLMKRFLEDLSYTLGYGGTITDEVLKSAQEGLNAFNPGKKVSITGFVRCHHCGVDFDPAEVDDNPFTDYHCGDCVKLYYEQSCTWIPESPWVFETERSAEPDIERDRQLNSGYRKAERRGPGDCEHGLQNCRICGQVEGFRVPDCPTCDGDINSFPFCSGCNGIGNAY